MNDLSALIPAAGLSSRMNGFKPLLPLYGETVLFRSVSVFKALGIEDVLVVAGHRGEEVAEEAVRAGARVVINREYEQGMFSSVLEGVKNFSADCRAFFVLPADIPLVRLETLALIAADHFENNAALTYPVFLGERGHPPLVRRDLLPDILAHDGQGGLRVVLDKWKDKSRDLAVADAGILHDMDYRRDYDEALARSGRTWPSIEECRALWEIMSLPDSVRAHCRAVAALTRAMCEALNASRSPQDRLETELAVSAALVHDVAKGLPKHAAEGAALMRSHGFHGVADIVADHADLELAAGAPLAEREMVFLADKFVRGSVPVPLEDRYAAKMEKFGSEPEIRKVIEGRLNRALDVCGRFEREAGLKMWNLARESLE